MTIGYGYGSEWHLLQYLGWRRDALTRKIEDLTGVSAIRWLDHRESNALTDAPRVRELVGLEFLDPEHPARHEWERRWPSRRGVHNWDAVGQGLSHDQQTWILIEAKAYTRELRWVRLFFVGHPEGFGERHGKSYLTRRRRGEEGGGGGSVTGGTVPSV